jgi:hypothetical protein
MYKGQSLSTDGDLARVAIEIEVGVEVTSHTRTDLEMKRDKVKFQDDGLETKSSLGLDNRSGSGLYTCGV